MKARFARAFLLYLLDMSTAIAGWVYGFGLPVKNWGLLIGLCLFLRFFWHMLSVAFITDDARYVSKVRLASKEECYEAHP